MLLTIIAAATALSGSGPTAARHHRPAYSGPMIQTPTWSRAPSFGEVAAAYPARAGGMDGSATLFCRVGDSGALSHCAVTDESPGGRGFGEAALSLAGKFTVSMDPAWSIGAGRFAVEVPIRLPNPEGRAIHDRLIENPVWLTKFTPAAAATYFPPEAAAKGLTTGRGVAECRVRADGSLQDCRGVSADPEDAGFSEAAAKAASLMRMSPWTKSGGPVDGAAIQIPIRLTLADAQETAASDQLVWRQTPTGEDVLREFPRLALVRNVSGQADMRCRVASSGAITHCNVVSESPAGWGFGSAARQLSSAYRLSMRAPGHPASGTWVEVSTPFETMSH